MEYTLYQIEHMTKSMSRQRSNKDKRFFDMLLMSNITDSDDIKKFRDSL